MNWLKTFVIVGLIGAGAFILLNKKLKTEPAEVMAPAPPYRAEEPAEPITVTAEADVAIPAPFTSEHEQTLAAVPSAMPFASEPSFDSVPGAVVSSYEAEDEVRTGVVAANAYRVDRSTSADVAEPQPGAGDLEFARTAEAVQVLLRQGQLAKAQHDLSPWFRRRRELSPEAAEYLISLLDELTGTVVYSREHLITGPFVVNQPIALQQVAEQCAVPPGLLAKINGLDPEATLQPGTELKVVLGPFHLELDVAAREIALYLVDGRYAGRFNVGIGQEVEVVEGKFVVSNKLELPPYTTPAGDVLQGGDPRNPLGMLLIEVGSQFAIHGTNDERNIGQTIEPGSIHMTNRDISDLYDMVLTSKTRVTVRR